VLFTTIYLIRHAHSAWKQDDDRRYRRHALILNGLDSSLGYDDWSRLSFPDAYRLELDGPALSVQRMWEPATK